MGSRIADPVRSLGCELAYHLAFGSSITTSKPTMPPVRPSYRHGGGFFFGLNSMATKLPYSFDINQYIEIEEGGDGAPAIHPVMAVRAQSATEVKARPRPKKRPPVCWLSRELRYGPRPKITASTRQLCDYLRANYDLGDWIMRRPHDDLPPQMPNARVSDALNATGRQDELHTLQPWQVAYARLGTARLDGHGRISSDCTMPVRVDVDCPGHSEKRPLTESEIQDGVDTVAAIKDLFGSALYVLPSPRGQSAPFILELGGSMSPESANALLTALQVSLQRFVTAKGFRSTLELQGAVTLTSEVAGAIQIDCRAHPMRLPTPPNDADIPLLLASRFTLTVVQGIQARIDGVVPAAPAQAKARKLRHRHPHRQSAHGLEKSGVKLTDYHHAVLAARSTLLPPDRRGDVLTDGEVRVVLDRANDVYESAGLAGGPRDKNRDDAMRACIHFQQRTHDPAKVGKGKSDLWFDIADDLPADQLCRSRIPKHRIAMEAWLNRKSLRGEVSYETLRLALLTVTKNIHGSKDGFTSTRAVQGMLQFFGHQCNGTLASVLLKLLEEAGLVVCLRRNLGRGDSCSRWAPMGPAWELPFVVNRQHDERERQNSPRRSRDGAGLCMISTYTVLKCSKQYEVHFPTMDDQPDYSGDDETATDGEWVSETEEIEPAMAF